MCKQTQTKAHIICDTGLGNNPDRHNYSPYIHLGISELFNIRLPEQDWDWNPEIGTGARPIKTLELDSFYLSWIEQELPFGFVYVYWVKDSNLYTKPQKPIPLFIAAMKPRAARLAGEEGDGLVTNEINPEILKNKLLPAFKEGVGRCKKSARGGISKEYDSLTKAVFMPASYDQDKEKAIKSITFWKGAMIKAFFKADIHDPREIQENGQVVGNDIMEQMGSVISNAEEGIKKIKKYTDLGFTDIVLINSSPDRSSLVKLISKEIIPGIIS